jgi:sugar/nucleoside kinase (ribokinase family)
MLTKPYDLIGAGNPIMDLLARVPDEFLAQHVSGEKGGMVLVDADEMHRLVTQLHASPVRAPGGSAANTTISAARLGLRTRYLGKIGSDETADTYHQNFLDHGVDGSRFKRAPLPNARCLSLITPDSQRTLRTCLGAAMTLSPDEVSTADFVGSRHAHIEGYLMFNPALAQAVVTSARAAGCTISIDLSSFEVVNVARDWLMAQIDEGVDVIFANEDEIHALYQTKTTAYDELAQRLASHGGLAAVKMGKDGAWIARGAELHRIEPVRANAVDTTGAGDAWAAGFLYGYLKGWSLPAAGALGSILGAECVQHIGPAIPESHWPSVRDRATALATT